MIYQPPSRLERIGSFIGKATIIFLAFYGTARLFADLFLHFFTA